MLQQFEIGGRGRIEMAGMAGGKGLEGLGGALGAEILRHRALDVLHGNGRAPAPEGRRDRRQPAGYEQIGLQPFDRRWPLRDRHHDVGQDIERERPQHAMQQRRQIGAEQRLRTQRLDAERSVLQQLQPRGRGLEEARQEQRVDPHGDTDQHASYRPSRGRATPEQAAEKRRCELRDGRERQQADRRQLRVAQCAIIEICHHHDGENRETANPEQEVAKILLADARFSTALQHQRHDDIVGNHDR